MREKQSDLLSDEAVLERIFKQLDDIFQKANYDIDQFIIGKKLEVPEESLGTAIGDLFDETCKLIRKADGSLDVEQIFKYKEDEEGYKVRKFLLFYKAYIDKELRPFWDVEELRHMEYDAFKEQAEFVMFNRMLLFTKEKSESSESVNKVMKKALNVCIDFAVMYRMDENMFCSQLQKVFAFNAEKGKFLYEIIKQNWQDIYQYEITRKLLDMNYEIKRLKGRQEEV